MARPEVTGRKVKKGRKVIRRVPLPGSGKTISQFCADWGICRATFYNWKEEGRAPAVVQPAGPGGWQLITPEAEEAWKARHSALAAAIEAAG
jgi:hypothetical protein